MPERSDIVAVSFLTREELRIVGNSLKHVYRVEPADLQDDKFDDLLRALDVQPDVDRRSRH